jgi:hypothetical protein
MGFLIATGSALLTAFAFHLILWRLRLPQSQLKTLLVLFFLTWCGAVGFAWASDWNYFALGEGSAFVGFLYFSLLYWAAALCYVITYSAMEGDSPTLSLTRHLHRKRAEGVSHEEIEEFFRQRPFVGARVKALVTDSIFIEESGGYRLASGKYLFFRLILGYRKVVFGPVKAGG